MLTLYYLPGACSIVPHVALVWSGLDFKAEKVTHDIIKSEEYLKKNPQGQVPLLVEGEWSLSQNVAIVDYINDLAPQANIFGGTDLHQKAKARQWLSFANSDLHPNFTPIFHTESIGDDQTAQKAYKAMAINKLIQLYGRINKQLQQTAYLSGSVICIADIYVYTTLRWTAAIDDLDLSAYGQLQPYMQRVTENKGVQTVLKAQGLI